VTKYEEAKAYYLAQGYTYTRLPTFVPKTHEYLRCIKPRCTTLKSDGSEWCDWHQPVEERLSA